MIISIESQCARCVFVMIAPKSFAAKNGLENCATFMVESNQITDCRTKTKSYETENHENLMKSKIFIFEIF